MQRILDTVIGIARQNNSGGYFMSPYPWEKEESVEEVAE